MGKVSENSENFIFWLNSEIIPFNKLKVYNHFGMRINLRDTYSFSLNNKIEKNVFFLLNTIFNNEKLEGNFEYNYNYV